MRTLGNQISPTDLDRLVLTKGYERLLSDVAAGTVDTLDAAGTQVNLAHPPGSAEYLTNMNS